MLSGEGDDRLQPVVLDDPAADVALALPGVAGEEGAAVVDLSDAAAELRALLHLGELVGEEEHLAIARAGNQGVLWITRMLDHEPRIAHVLLAAHALQVGLPVLAVGRVGEHEVELARREGVVRKCGVFRAAHDVVGGFALALEQEVGLADGISLGVDLLAIEVGGDVLVVLGCELPKGLLGHGQHAAGAAGTVVEEIGAGFYLVGDGQEDELRHECHGVARGPVFACFLVVLLVEASHQFLEDRAHAVVVEAGMPDGAVGVLHRGRAQVDVRAGELLDQRAYGVGLGEPRDLVAELEVVENVLHVGREPIQVGLKISRKLLSISAGSQVTQGELRGIVKRLSRCLPQRRVLFDQPRRVERGLHVKDGLLAVFQHRIKPAQHGHWKNDVAVLAADVKIAQNAVGDAPNVVRNPVQVAVAHLYAHPLSELYICASLEV